MLENEVNETSQFHPSCSSAAQLTNHVSHDYDENDLEEFDGALDLVLDELVDDAMWELSFEIHKAAKLGYFFLEDPERRKNQIVEDAEKDIYGFKLKSKGPMNMISCPSCTQKLSATKFASHLAKCIGISGRNSSRQASKKIAETTYSSDIDENDYESDSSFSGSRKKTRKGKKSSRKKPKLQGYSLPKTSLESNANYQEMTYEKRKAFFNQKCGVISKRTNKMCMNPHKCSQHSDEQRRDVRHSLLRDMGDQLTNDGQIDVDTVDEGSSEFSFIPHPQTNCFTTNKNMPSAADFAYERKNSTSSKNGSGQVRKRKTGFDSTNLVSSSSHTMPTGSSFDSM